MSAFEKTSLYPVNPTPVITKILHEQLRRQQPINPAYASLLPSGTRFQVAADALNDIRQRYGHLMSWPSRDDLRVLSTVSTEAIAMASHSQGIVADKNSRTRAYANRMKRGKIVRPRGDFITSSGMADITQEVEELRSRQAQQQTRQEIKTHLRRICDEMQKTRNDYKVGKRLLVDGRVKTLNFKPWLELTARDVEFYSLEESFRTLMQELKDPAKEPFFIDITKENNSARDIRARAVTRPRSLTDMSSLPGSDDVVHFTGLDPNPYDQDDAGDEGERDSSGMQSIPASSPLAAAEVAVDSPCPRWHTE